MTSTRRDTSLDNVRGLLLVLMAINHIFAGLSWVPLSQYSLWFFEPLGYLSWAELFVFLSGFNTARSHRASGTQPGVVRRRVLRLYRMHMMVLIACVAIAYCVPSGFQYGQWGLVAPDHPLRSIALGALFLYQPFLLDILPMYLVLAALAPIALAGLASRRRALVVGFGSASAWLLAQWVGGERVRGAIVLPFFNLLAWQTLFLLGVLAAEARRWPPRWHRAAMWTSALVVVLCFGLRNDYQISARWIDRSHLAPLRLLNCVAFFYLASSVGRHPAAARWVERLRAFGSLGRNSLAVFGWHVISIFIGHVLGSWISDFGLIGRVFAATLVLACLWIVPAFRALEVKWGDSARAKIAAWAASGRWLPCAVALMPLAYLPGWGYGYREPKVILFFGIAGVCGSCLVVLKRQGRALRFSWIAATMLALVVVRVLSYSPNVNAGQWALSVGYACGLFLVTTYVGNTTLSALRVAVSVLGSLGVVLVGSLAAVLFRVVLVSSYAPFGSTLGLKNSVAAYYMQCAPWVVLLIVLGRARKGPLRSVASLALVALAAMLWMVLAYRTRTAWWMLAAQAVVFVMYALRPGRRLRTAATVFSIALVVAVLALWTVPNALVWKSPTPYVDSLSTMASWSASSGRDAIWKVVYEMVRAHPLRGVGAGNAAVRFRGFVPAATVDPKTFAFLQPDLGAFNDYLQEAAETGVLGAVLLVVLAMGTPWRAWRHAPSGGGERLTSLCLGLSTLSIAGAAGVDYPFNRPESLLLFALAAGILGRSRVGSTAARPVLISVTRCATVGVALIALAQCGSFALRAYGDEASVRLQTAAHRLWPWDVFWSERYLALLLSNGRSVEARKYVAERERYWPGSPDVALLRGLIAESNRDAGGAEREFRAALLELPGGRCHVAAIPHFLRVASEDALPPECVGRWSVP